MEKESEWLDIPKIQREKVFKHIEEFKKELETGKIEININQKLKEDIKGLFPTSKHKNNYICGVDVANEGSDKSAIMVVDGDFLKCFHIDTTGRCYPEDLFKKQMNKFNTKIMMHNIRSKGICCQTSLES
jgi:hypothetical protein